MLHLFHIFYYISIIICLYLSPQHVHPSVDDADGNSVGIKILDFSLRRHLIFSIARVGTQTQRPMTTAVQPSSSTRNSACLCRFSSGSSCKMCCKSFCFLNIGIMKFHFDFRLRKFCAVTLIVVLLDNFHLE